MEQIGGNGIYQYHRRDIPLVEKIGEGSFGIVYKGKLGGQEVAVKQLKQIVENAFNNVNDVEEARKEIFMMANLRHPNIVSLHGIAGLFTHNQVPWMLFELMPDGTLRSFVERNDVSEGQLINFCRDISGGMNFLHMMGVCHRDLAARNVLLDVSKNVAKVSDLGMSTFARNDPAHPHRVMSVDLKAGAMPVAHYARECLAERRFSSASDVWSFGVTMHEIFSGGLIPYRGMHLDAVRSYVIDGHNPLCMVPLQISKEILNVMKMIFKVNRQERPSFKTLSPVFDQLSKGSFSNMIHPCCRKNSTPPVHGGFLAAHGPQRLACLHGHAHPAFQQPHVQSGSNFTLESIGIRAN